LRAAAALVSAWLACADVAMTEYYSIADQLSDYVGQVIRHLSLSMSVEAAASRVLEHLRVVLLAGMEGTPSEEMALLLMKVDSA
jgi:hypothetical protein